jgi:hypothetical protein
MRGRNEGTSGIMKLFLVADVSAVVGRGHRGERSSVRALRIAITLVT